MIDTALKLDHAHERRLALQTGSDGLFAELRAAQLQ